MHAFHFGPSEAPLFGVHYPPPATRGGTGRAAVLLCYPGPEEYMRVHWAYRQLAVKLTQGGAHVMKFDYYGTGDPAGASSAGDADRWRDDVVTALAELRDVSGAARLSLVGIRLGAALAATLPAAPAARGEDFAIEKLILWDPVRHGGEYLRELSELEARRLRNSRYPLEKLKNPNCPELLGYATSEPLRRSLAALDLSRATLTRAADTVVVASEARAEYVMLMRCLADGGPAARIDVDDDCRWRTQELLEEALLPAKIVEAIAARALGDGAP